ncbi:MAG: MBL fold metallo-hydrolase [Pseudomonadota bacterium]
MSPEAPAADELVLLGVKGGPSIRPGGAMPSASLLRMGGQTVVIDCGLGVAKSLVEAGIALTEIDAVFITHLHSDHVLELGPLLYTAWTSGLSKPIALFGPPGIEAYWQGFLASMAFDQTIRIEDEGRVPIGELITLSIIDEGPVTDLAGIAVSALRVDHPPVTECYALRFESAAKAIVFSADTCYFPPLAAFAEGAALLVHEAMLTDGIEALVQRLGNAQRLRAHLLASHTKAADVGRIASAADVNRLVLNHLVPVDDPRFSEADWRREVSQNWPGATIVGHDGARIAF